jgi:enoyl-CoA hydratase/carnithine racemase
MIPSTDLVLETRQAGVVTLQLNRPEQFNPLSSAMLTELADRLQRCAASSEDRVVILKASGKAFCAGHDLREMKAHPESEFYTTLFNQCSRLMMQLQRLPQPVIAQVQGVATAAGCQLVAMCDLAVASSNAQFAVSGVNLGLFCSTPSVALSRNLSRKKAFEWLVTGEFVDAYEALEAGLINRVVAPDALDHATQSMAQQIAAKSPQAIRMGKALFYKQLEMGIEAAYQLAGHTMACNMMGIDAQQGVAAFLEKRLPKTNVMPATS